jgi:hypothetical protein
MAKTLREFIDKELEARDFYINEAIDRAYVIPLAKAWNDYGIKKHGIIFLSILIAHKYEDEIKKIDNLDCEKVIKSNKPATDLGELTGFSDEELTFFMSILIEKYGIEDVVTNINQRWKELRTMAEVGVRVLYCKIYKEKIIPTDMFETLLNLDKLKL